MTDIIQNILEGKKSGLLIKICGMSEQAVIDRAAELGTHMCGFIFHESSPRSITPKQASKLNTGKMARVGVFVRQNAEEIYSTVCEARLDFIQLHGFQGTELAACFPSEKIIRVLWPNRYDARIKLQADIDAFASSCGMYLLDAGMGSGITLDWSSLNCLHFPHPWILSGGIGPDNVRTALSMCSPHGLDMNSRLESNPGKKSIKLMERVFAQLSGLQMGRL